jgi:magnesium chelatase family protein
MAPFLFYGELGLSGDLAYTKGALPVALLAKRAGYKGVILPRSSAEEAGVVSGVPVYGFESIQELVLALKTGDLTETTINPTHRTATKSLDFTEIQGHVFAKRGIEIAVSGGHNLLLSGPPGSGKTLLIQGSKSILPPLAFEEALEVTTLYASVEDTDGLIEERPFRAPHHSASLPAILGGGTLPRPGELSLAHKGILFLDEFPEFSRDVIEGLRQPLEDRSVSVSRANHTSRFPADVMLFATMNPCPCGYYLDPDIACTCLPSRRASYQSKLSGPILDRFDLAIEVPKIPHKELLDGSTSESSKEVKERVARARARQKARYEKFGITTNAELSPTLLRELAILPRELKELYGALSTRLHLSSRASLRAVKVAQTIADLEGARTLTRTHLLEALQYRPRFDSRTNERTRAGS